MKKQLLCLSLIFGLVRADNKAFEETLPSQIEQEAVNINYNYETSVLSSDDQFPLKKEIKSVALAKNIALNGSKFFDTKDICDTPLTNENLRKIGGKEITITTEDGIQIECTYLDRKKDKVVVVGPGFTNAKEKMSPLAHIYIDYDVLMMTFRGHANKNFTLNPIVKLTEVNSDAGLGAREEKDVFAVVNYLRNLTGKYYKQIVGHGICYGASMFAKAQGIKEYNKEVLFDKLVLDGGWISLNKFKKKIISDPYLIAHPQRGGAPDYLKWIFSKKIVQNTIQGGMETTYSVKFDDIDFTHYTNQITIPVLFFYGKNDLVVHRDEFEQLWSSTKSKDKVAIITSNEHVWNHLREKELYKMICEVFIECDNQKEFLSLLNNKDQLLEYLFEQLVGNAEEIEDGIFKPTKKPKTLREQYMPGKIITVGAIAALSTAALVYAYQQDMLNSESLGNGLENTGKFFGDLCKEVGNKSSEAWLKFLTKIDYPWVTQVQK